MNVKINISSTYGFDHNWTLVCETKTIKKEFFLGQDCKFCSRVLNMDTSYVVAKIGTAVIGEGTEGNKKLAKFICKTLGLTAKNIEKIEAWELCCQ